MPVLSKHNQMPLGVILAAGRTQRINYLDTPKPLLLVYGKPLIIWQIEYLREAGICDIIVIVGSHSAEIRARVNEAETRDVKVNYIEEPNDDVGILNSFALAAGQMESDCVVTSCDLVFERNPYFSLGRRSDIEILVSKNQEENAFSGAPIRVKTRFKKLNQMSRILDNYNALHAGIYYFTKKGINDFLKIIQSAPVSEDLPEIIMRLNHKAAIKLAFLPKMQWFDINAPDTLLRAEMLARRKNIAPNSSQTPKLFREITSTTSFAYTKTQETSIIIKPGIISHLGEIKLMDGVRENSQHIIITDENVDSLFGNIVLSQLQSAGYKVVKFVIPAGEQSKSIEVYNDLAERIIALGIDEQSIIFALGGGVVANVSGMLAATLYRGIGLIHLPTTIMNMLDVSISLKQGINGQKGKNLVGSYYQPLLVVIDPSISIPDWLVQDGISEAIKHAICQDADFYGYLLKNTEHIADVEFRTEIIERTIRLKIELMHEDMLERKRAMILQYGHEVGHAIEFLSNFELTHGQSIAIGMRFSAELAKLMQTGKDMVDDHKKVLRSYKLPCKIPEYISARAVIDSLKYNKKTQHGQPRFVLPEFIGKAWKIKGEYGIPCPMELVSKAIDKSYEQ